MANIEDLERIDRVVDNIVDLQAKLKEDVESRDFKLQKYKKLFDKIVKVKSNLEAKISGFERQFIDMFNANKILETNLESKNARIGCLETKVKALESKISGLEASKENFLPEKGTAVLKAQNGVNNNVNKRRQNALEEIDTNKKIKINVEDIVKEEACQDSGAVSADGVHVAGGVLYEALGTVDSEIVNGERHSLSYGASVLLIASGEQRPFLGRDSKNIYLTYNNLNGLQNMLSFSEAVFSFGFGTFKQNRIALLNHLQLNPVIAQTWIQNYVGDKSKRTIFNFKFDDKIIIAKIRRIADNAAPLPV